MMMMTVMMRLLMMAMTILCGLCCFDYLLYLAVITSPSPRLLSSHSAVLLELEVKTFLEERHYRELHRTPPAARASE